MTDRQATLFDWTAFPCITSPSNHASGYVRDGMGRYLHRVLFEEAFGPLPADLTIDHLCNTKTCLEVFHMEPVTRGENTRRAMERSGKLVDISKPCRRGHAPNWVRPRGQGWRCRTCQNEDRRRG